MIGMDEQTEKVQSSQLCEPVASAEGIFVAFALSFWIIRFPYTMQHIILRALSCAGVLRF